MSISVEELRKNLANEEQKWVREKTLASSFYNSEFDNISNENKVRFSDYSLPFPNDKPFYYPHEFDIYPDDQFLELAYQLILGRSPESEEYNCYLEGLRTGYFTRDEVLGLLRFSKEGKERGVRIKGLRIRFFISKARHIPVVGLFFDIVYTVLALPRIVKISGYLRNRFSEFENHVFWLKERIGFQDNRIRQQDDKIRHQELQIVKQDAKIAQYENKVARQDAKIAQYESKIIQQNFEIRQLLNRITTLRHAVFLLERQLYSNNGSLPANNTEGSIKTSSFFYSFFEEDFRGDPEKVKNSFIPYLSLIKPLSSINELPVLDLGCGRGEWLRLLREHGIRAIGVDTNELALSYLEKEGLAFFKEDIFAFLERSAPESFSAVTAFHVIEHIPSEKWLSFFSSVFKVLTRGGIFIIETPNPRNILIASGDFYRDPTHIRPVFPDTIRLIGEIAGFSESRVWFFDNARSRLIPAETVKFETLNDYINISPDFAWSGRKLLR